MLTNRLDQHFTEEKERSQTEKSQNTESQSEKSNQLRDDGSREKREVELSSQTSAATVGFKAEVLATTKSTTVDLVIVVKEGAVREQVGCVVTAINSAATGEDIRHTSREDTHRNIGGAWMQCREWMFTQENRTNEEEGTGAS